MSEILRRALRRLGSAETTAVSIVLCAVVALAGIYLPIRTANWMTLPLALVIVNLLAAMATNAKLKSQPMLFALHAALVVLIGTIGIDRLTSMTGRVEVTEGTVFDAANVKSEGGMLHRLRLGEVRFMQGSFEIKYAPGMKRRQTESMIAIPEQGGGWREVRVGDDTPLIFGDYRFYTTHNKGFAPVLTYVSAGGGAKTGSIHLPSYPINESQQGITWTPSGSARPLKVWLHIPKPVYEVDKAWTFAKPANASLVVIDGEQRHELRLGEIAELGTAQLRYDELRSWMGYTIVSQSMNHWIAAASAMAGLALLGYLLSVLLIGARVPSPEARHGG